MSCAKLTDQRGFAVIQSGWCGSSAADRPEGRCSCGHPDCPRTAGASLNIKVGAQQAGRSRRGRCGGRMAGSERTGRARSRTRCPFRSPTFHLPRWWWPTGWPGRSARSRDRRTSAGCWRPHPLRGVEAAVALGGACDVAVVVPARQCPGEHARVLWGRSRGPAVERNECQSNLLIEARCSHTRWHRPARVPDALV